MAVVWFHALANYEYAMRVDEEYAIPDRAQLRTAALHSPLPSAR